MLTLFWNLSLLLSYFLISRRLSCSLDILFVVASLFFQVNNIPFRSLENVIDRFLKFLFAF